MTFRAFLPSPRTTPSSTEPTRQNPGAEPKANPWWTRLLALGLAALLLPCTSMDLLAQQAPSGYPANSGYGQSGYPPQQQDYPPPPPDEQQGAYPQAAPNYAAPQPYQQQPNYPPQQPSQQYSQQPQQEYAPPPAYSQQQPYPSQQYPQQDEQQPYQQQPYQQQAQQPQGLAPDQLEQLVAPIALDPDALLAQILAASTFPTQIIEAERWRQAQPGASPQDIADGANAQDWDPSVKALTAFPQVLDELAQNLSWTTELGNAYYNQPQDVFDAVQTMRQRAQAAGTLQSTPQEAVSDDQGYIALAPPNPQIVYVPSYDPWTAYGAPVAPWPGFSLVGALGSFFGGVGLHFGPGLVMSAFTGMPWGILGWGLSWLGHCLFFDHQGWYPHSREVADWGLPYGGSRYGWGHANYARGGFDRGMNRGYDRGYDRGNDRGYEHGNGGYNRAGAYAQRGFADNRGFNNNRALAGNRGFADPHSSSGSSSGSSFGGSFANRPASRGYSSYGQQAYSRTPAFNARSGYGNEGAYRNEGTYRNEGAYRGYNSGVYGRSQQTYRSAAPAYNRAPQMNSRGYNNSFRSAAPSYRAYASPSGFGRNSFSEGSRGYSGYSSRSERSSYGGGRSSFGRSEHFSGGHSGGYSGGHSFGGGGHSSHGGGGGHASHGGGGHRR